ncbi:DUF6492 family protein [Hoeflea sp. G2-23]|uniref:DUF6492 family protein n=1 Tax=Hoeflea algicola TaxID=2983763 RepID=A0ABT3ZDS5_9HYPH|nr:DUF6492 family protein [Hoeflea algicola]MCY0149952.1 DUF6492 family protein [Hoeflea algicola]
MKTAVMTASYAGDFDRCALLCESMDRFMQGDWHHYLLVERADVALFRSLEGGKRTIVSEAELFPFWLRSFPDPLSLGRRRLWLSPFSLPLRGWHAQQIRRLAMARHVDAETLLSIDSDVVLVRPFDPVGLWREDRLRMFRADNGAHDATPGHLAWLAHAGDILGLPQRPAPAHDYISNMVAWRVDTARALLDHLESHNGKGWIRAVISSRAISECMIYGRFVDEVQGGAGHYPDERSLSHVLWFKETFPQTTEGLMEFMRGIRPDQVAIGVQSFVGHPLSEIRKAAFAVTPI